MSEILKGNFKTQRAIEVKQQGDTLEDRFEREAMKRLGGSIAFVSKQKVTWGDDPPTEASSTNSEKKS
jgi:hypothetical protein